MKRRYFLLASGAALAGAAFWLRPQDEGSNHSSYFMTLQRGLKEAGIGRPVMLVDEERLASNCKLLMASLPPGRAYRIVAKSLPSVPLIERVMKLTGSNRVMVFHQPFMNALALARPDCDMLLGKPMPVAAAYRFFQELPEDSSFNADAQLQWLVDDISRLEQYLTLARKLNRTLRINLEIDVGLHRGGLQSTQQLDACLKLIKANPGQLVFSGFMGYDAHVGKLPPMVETAQESLRKSNAIYQSFIDHLNKGFPELAKGDLCLNGAGSPTVMLHDKNTPLNELAAGSCLVKGTDFDIDSLASFLPAAFIATPVIKRSDGLQMPGPIPLGKAWALWDPNRRQTFFIYGGYWKARPVSPPGVRDNPMYGFSTNQMMFNGSGSINLNVDDFLFLRPTQSEFVLLQFGDLAVIRDGKLQTWWPPLEQGHGA